MFGAHSFFQIVEARPEDTSSRSAFLRTCASGFHGLAAREHRLRAPISCLGKRRLREDPGGPAYTPSFPAVGDPKARTSRAAGYSKIRDYSGSESSAKFFQCFRRVRALEDCEKREREAKRGVEIWGKSLGKWLRITEIASYLDEFLLKPCASRQEKLSFCHKNSAAPDADIGDLRRIAPRGQKQVAGTTDFEALAKVNPLARGHDSARNQVAIAQPAAEPVAGSSPP